MLKYITFGYFLNCNLVKYLYDFIDLETFKKSPFHYTDWFIGILVLAYYSPHKKEQYNPLYKTTKQGFKPHRYKHQQMKQKQFQV